MKNTAIEARLGEAIKKSRWQKMMKQKDLSKKLEVSQSFICDIEHGRRSPSLEMLERLEEILGPIWVNK